MRNKRKNKYMLLLILLLGITLGYAAISTTLKIVGDATVTKQTWNVYWGVPTVTEGSVSTTAPTRGADSGDPANTKLTWNVTLNLPGDFYEFEVDAVNAGTIDAMITGITPTVSPALPTNPEYIKYSITYADGIEPAVNHLLPKGTKSGSTITPTTERYKVRVYYDETAATRDTINNMAADTTYTFNLELTYGQATDEAIPKPIKVWVLPEGKTADTLEVGDEICGKSSLGLDDQCFSFVRYDNNKAVLFAKTNLNVGKNAKGSETFKQDDDVRGYVFGKTTYGNVGFSYTTYWKDGSNIKEKYGSSYPIDVYDDEYQTEPNFSETCNYSSNCYYTEGYSMAYYVEKYKQILETSGASIVEARLLTLDDTAAIGCTVNNVCSFGYIRYTSFWLGTVNSGGICFINSGGSFLCSGSYNGDSDMGVRPVIVVEKSNL